MSADAAHAESLSRIEHKVDLMLEFLARLVGPGSSGKFDMVPVGGSDHTCPVCTKKVGYQVDIFKKVVVRNCGCHTGKQAPIDLGLFTTPTASPRTERDNGNSSAEQEDGINPNRGGGNRRR